MKISLNWLKEYLPLNETSAEIARLLTEHAFETTVEKKEFALDLSKIVVGEVVECQKHPNADKLSLTKVKIGKKNHQIICGAPNVRTGLKVAVALPGVQVLDRENKLVTLNEAVIRGVESQGMLCSERELGLSDSHNGIMELSDDVVSGMKLTEFFTQDTVLDAEVLPDRAADCSSYYGIARELGAIMDRKAKLPKYNFKVGKRGSLGFKLKIENSRACPRYVATKITNIKNGPSPEWLQQRLLSAGLRPQNLIVDVTNYVLLEMGQPTHAFDSSEINGTLGVRESREGEKIKTLDGVERQLPESVLVIDSNGTPVALAGLMGGETSAVKPGSREIILEAALFNAQKIRYAVNKLNFRTEASDRFTRGITSDHVAAGTNRVIELLQEYGGAKVVAQTDSSTRKEKRITIVVKQEEFDAVLGVKISSSKIKKMLELLGFEVSSKDGVFRVVAPLFRNDITIAENVIEEVGQIYGYENIPSKLPNAPVRPVVLPEPAKDTRVIQNTLKGAGWMEAYFYSFAQEEESSLLNQTNEALELINPMRSDQTRLRTSLLPNILHAARSVVKKESVTKMFEIGHVYLPNKEENNNFAGAIIRRNGTGAEDFYEVKGVVEQVVSELGLESVKFVPVSSENIFIRTWQIGTQATIIMNEVEVGFISMVAKELLDKLSIRGTIALFEIDLTKVSQLKRLETTYNPPLPYPTIQRDVSLVIPDGILVDQVEDAIATAGRELVKDVDFVDIYDEGEKRSVTLRIVYGSAAKTLTDAEVNSVQEEILKEISENLGVKERV